ncbi:MAG: hypothetical protein OEM82_07915 [Acidobacteriota bacterium]|nr:hypothetical protein [Acidobacteriota bacterium]MDH3529946.1 hypothetical protein [Acidobacteriota bacterium]
MVTKLTFKAFESSWDSWEKLFQKASDFANSVGRECVLNISHSCDGGNRGVVTVWYWKEKTESDFVLNRTDLGG